MKSDSWIKVQRRKVNRFLVHAIKPFRNSKLIAINRNEMVNAVKWAHVAFRTRTFQCWLQFKRYCLENSRIWTTKYPWWCHVENANSLVFSCGPAYLTIKLLSLSNFQIETSTGIFSTMNTIQSNWDTENKCQTLASDVQEWELIPSYCSFFIFIK